MALYHKDASSWLGLSSYHTKFEKNPFIGSGFITKFRSAVGSKITTIVTKIILTIVDSKASTSFSKGLRA